MVSTLPQEQYIPVPEGLRDRAGAQVAQLTAFPTLPRDHLDYPLASYWISSSHNTYLHKHQLYGKSDANNYYNVIKRGGRCVEIDAWDGGEEDEKVIVYHGYTAVGKLGLRSVCEAINRAVEPESLPVIIALENHTSHENQLYIASTMKEIFGDKLITERFPHTIYPNQLTPGECRGKILVATEHYIEHEEEPSTTDPGALRDNDSSASSDETSEEEGEAKDVKNKRKEAKVSLIPELASLGVYSNSLKPNKPKAGRKSFWERPLFHPPQRIVNTSELMFSKILPIHFDSVLLHSCDHLFRIYPKGLRISSRNLDPASFWRAGAQICALNWQTFDKAVQLNEAMFFGTDGWLLKPETLRSYEQIKKEENNQNKDKCSTIKLKVDILGASALPLPNDVKADENLKPYLITQIMTSQKVHQSSTSVFHVPKDDKESRGRNPIWDHHMEFEFPDEDLIFVRFKIWHKDSMFSRDDLSAVYAARLDNIQGDGEFRGVQLSDVDGKKIDSHLVVKVKMEKN